MRSLAWWCLVLCGGVLFVACTDDDDAAVAAGGTGGVATGGASGSAGQVAAGGAAGAPSVSRGERLEFVTGSGEVPYAIGENPYGIQGNAFVVRSALGNTITIGDTPGEICISGSLAEVPGGNYGQYWGVEIGFNLNQVAGAGGTAGAGDTTEPWLPGQVVGFSFVIEGPTINLVRFKALPAGMDPALESSVYCNGFTPTSGQVVDVLFADMTQYCWNATANVVMPTEPGLINVSWQLPADANVGERPFDWCLRDLRPLLAQ